MGACVSSSSTEVWSDEEVTRVEGPYSSTDKTNKTGFEEARSTISRKAPRPEQVLLLGTGDSGKSTILKQMRLYIHHQPFTRYEIESFRQLILCNVVTGMCTILEAMVTVGLSVSPEKLQYIANVFCANSRGELPPAWLIEPLRALWNDRGVQEVLERGDEVSIPDNLPYFFSRLDALFDPGYDPSVEDILHSHSRTLGLYKTTLDGLTLVDTGGQRPERKKWRHCFGPNVTTIVFVVSLSGYDQSLLEDTTKNQMADAMDLWSVLCAYFKNTYVSMILVFNKNDLFEEKVKRSGIGNFFPDFDGELGDAEAGRAYFKRRFVELAGDFVNRTLDETRPHGQLYVWLQRWLCNTSRFRPTKNPMFRH
ncbi:guanine nucleotide binding protein, alpha subunit [Vararia minispora EC-137]|uniref:Guanine nucleotide binding protein, alpha subunit n=1 Tax=Vararia minispora EC-137 TaxID=1314806 RepID=A0ACB8QG33_9AGAM|nr:guanine nucleotide binding protein, alpha subunit [Vararia minispora EC-137]